MKYNKFKLYQLCFIFLFIFFISINCIYACCSGLQVVDDWKWLDEPKFSKAKKAVFEHYRQMTEQYIEWRKSTRFSNPNTLNTVASKARILLINDSGVVEGIIEANHGRRILHVDESQLVHSSPAPFHETMFFPKEEETYLDILQNEQKILRPFSTLRSWYVTQRPMIKDAINSYKEIESERLFYTERIKERNRSITPKLRDVFHGLREDLYKDENKGGTHKDQNKEIKEIFLYRDLHQHDSEAFACDNLFKSLKNYQVGNQYDKQKIKAFVLFLNERDPCLCCSVMIKDDLSREIFEMGLCSEVVPIVVSMDNYKERNWNKVQTDIIIRNRIKESFSEIEAAAEAAEAADEKEDETISEPPPYILRLYRNEHIKGNPLYVAAAIHSMFQQKVEESSSIFYRRIYNNRRLFCGGIVLFTFYTLYGSLCNVVVSQRHHFH
jgi:hypothetical protein